MLWERVLTALYLGPLLLVLIYLGGEWLFLGVFWLSLWGLQEFYWLAEGAGLQPNRVLGYASAVLMLVALGLGWGFEPSPDLVSGVSGWLVVLLAVTVMVALLQQMLRPAEPGAIANAGAVVLGVMYVPFLLSYLLRIRSSFTHGVVVPGRHAPLSSGVLWLTAVVVTAWAGDTAAYAVGKLIGRHKLCPRISPGKTVEGAIAGLLAATAVAAAMGRWLGLPVKYAVILGVALAVAGQLGDLCESVMKRQAGVKDSGRAIPGHGGVLDRFDSLIFSAPVAFYYLTALKQYFPI